MAHYIGEPHYPGTQSQLKGIIEQTINKGSSTPNTFGREGTIYTKFFFPPVGTASIPINFNQAEYVFRYPAFTNVVVVINGEVITSYPR